jgi:hypothetical protein
VKLSETDALKVRLVTQKESNVDLHKDLAALREENARLVQVLAAREKELAELKGHVLSIERQKDIGHLAMSPVDVVRQEEDGFYLYRGQVQRGPQGEPQVVVHPRLTQTPPEEPVSPPETEPPGEIDPENALGENGEDAPSGETENGVRDDNSSGVPG